jgi:hypothetical protein
MYRELVDLRLASASVDSNGNFLSTSRAVSKKTITHSDESQLNGVHVISNSAPAVEVVKPAKATVRASFPSIAVTDSRSNSLKRQGSTVSQLTRHATVFVGDDGRVTESQV